MDVAYFDADTVEAAFGLDSAIASQRRAFRSLASGRAAQRRAYFSTEADDSTVFCYTARLDASHGAVCKFGSVNPRNGALGLPSVHAVVVVLDTTGRPLALLDGTPITTWRTAAASAVAVDVLTSPSPKRLAVLGAGVQACAHIRAIERVRPLQEVRIWSPSQSRVELSARLQQGREWPVRAAPSPRDACAGSDIVVTCTLSKAPVLEGRWLRQGTTVIGVGSFEPTRCEVDHEVLRRSAAVVVDDVMTARENAGPVVVGLREGWIDASRILALGDVIIGTSSLPADGDLLFYNSTGMGVQDAAAAACVLDALGLSQHRREPPAGDPLAAGGGRR
jgi:ornithine cyclodeaminase/alanine dehydrogenase-like protein (mu-crystallin family)